MTKVKMEVTCWCVWLDSQRPPAESVCMSNQRTLSSTVSGNEMQDIRGHVPHTEPGSRRIAMELRLRTLWFGQRPNKSARTALVGARVRPPMAMRVGPQALGAAQRSSSIGLGRQAWQEHSTDLGDSGNVLSHGVPDCGRRSWIQLHVSTPWHLERSGNVWPPFSAGRLCQYRPRRGSVPSGPKTSTGLPPMA
jgi:hypothetical protein